MSDIGGPDIEVEVARLELEIMGQQLNIKQAQYRALQLQRELNQINKNISAHKTAIKDMEAGLASLTKGE